MSTFATHMALMLCLSVCFCFSMSHVRQETQDKDSVQEPCFIEPENYCGAYIHLKNSTPLKHFKPEKKHPCGMSQCSLRFKRRQELDKQHARTFGFATRLLTSGHKLMYTSILMPDYVSRYKHSSIHIFSYILFLHTFFIYIYKDIYIYLSIYQPMFSQLWIRINIVHRFHVNS